jgi:hypothetical protein
MVQRRFPALIPACRARGIDGLLRVRPVRLGGWDYPVAYVFARRGTSCATSDGWLRHVARRHVLDGRSLRDL